LGAQTEQRRHARQTVAAIAKLVRASQSDELVID